MIKPMGKAIRLERLVGCGSKLSLDKGDKAPVEQSLAFVPDLARDWLREKLPDVGAQAVRRIEKPVLDPVKRQVEMKDQRTDELNFCSGEGTRREVRVRIENAAQLRLLRELPPDLKVAFGDCDQALEPSSHRSGTQAVGIENETADDSGGFEERKPMCGQPGKKHAPDCIMVRRGPEYPAWPRSRSGGESRQFARRGHSRRRAGVGFSSL